MNAYVMNIDVARGLSTVVGWVRGRFGRTVESYAEHRRRRDAARYMRTVDNRLLRDVGLQRVGTGLAVRSHESA